VDAAAPNPDNLSDTTYSGVLEFNLQVLEYLLGSGGSEIVAVGLEPRPFKTEEEARGILPEIVASRDKRWDSKEAIVFLQDSNEILPSTKRAGRYYLEFLTAYYGDGYTVASPHSKLWLPAASTGGASGTSGSNTQLFLTDAPPAEEEPSGASGASGQGQGYETKTLAQLKARIAAIKKEIDAGDGSEKYRQCVIDKYRAESIYRWKLKRAGVSVVRDEKELASGSAAGSVIYEDGGGDGELPDKRGRYWLEGRDKDFFKVTTFGFAPYDWSGDGVNDRFGYGRRIASVRPLPAREYRFFFEGMWAGVLICNGYSDAEKNYYELVVDVTAPAGTLHEAFFDPVSDGDAVGVSGANGVLEPSSFTFDSAGDVKIERIEWEANRLEIEFSPHNRLAGHHIDFIALDGTVSLRLDFDHASEIGEGTSRALSWNVCEQPWSEGDLLMLRIAAGVPDDGVQATNDVECPVSGNNRSSVPAAVLTANS